MKTKSASVPRSILRSLPKPDYNDNRVTYKLITMLSEIPSRDDYFEYYSELDEIKEFIEQVESLVDNRNVFLRIRHLGEWREEQHYVLYVRTDDSYYQQCIEDTLKYGTGKYLQQIEDKETVITILNTGIIPVKVLESEINHLDLELTE
jgi:hypothetical protein